MTAPQAQRSLDEVRDGLWNLHREAGTLHTKAIQLKATRGLAWQQAPLEALESQLDGLYTRFLNLEADLSALAGKVPPDFNSAVRHAAIYQSHFGVRDSVRGVPSDTSARLNAIGGRLESMRTMWFSAASILLAVVGLALAAVAL